MKRNSMSRYFLSIAIVFIAALNLNAQNNSLDQKLYEDLHGHGSMNVVFAVIGIILIGLFISIWRMDRKVSKLEKEINERKS